MNSKPGSWVIVLRASRKAVAETFSAATARQAHARPDLAAIPAHEYLAGLNAAIRAGDNNGRILAMPAHGTALPSGQNSAD